MKVAAAIQVAWGNSGKSISGKPEKSWLPISGKPEIGVAAALVPREVICYIERRRFDARPHGPRSFPTCGRGGIGRRTSLRC